MRQEAAPWTGGTGADFSAVSRDSAILHKLTSLACPACLESMVEVVENNE